MFKRVATTAQPLARGYATKSVQAPITIHSIGGRYAQALYSAASQKSALDTAEKELNEIGKLISTNDQFANFLEDPSISRANKTAALSGILKKGGFSDVTHNLFSAMAENNRLAESGDVINAFGQIMRAHRKEIATTIISAEALSDAHVKNILAALQKNVSGDKKLLVSTAVDKSILGGFIVELPDKRIDMSIASKIASISSRLRQSI